MDWAWAGVVDWASSGAIEIAASTATTISARYGSVKYLTVGPFLRAGPGSPGYVLRESWRRGRRYRQASRCRMTPAPPAHQPTEADDAPHRPFGLHARAASSAAAFEQHGSKPSASVAGAGSATGSGGEIPSAGRGGPGDDGGGAPGLK